MEASLVDNSNGIQFKKFFKLISLFFKKVLQEKGGEK